MREMRRHLFRVFDARPTPASNSTRREMVAMHASDLATRQYQRRGSGRGLAALNAPCREPIPVPLVLQLIKAIFSVHSIAAELNHDVTDTFHGIKLSLFTKQRRRHAGRIFFQLNHYQTSAWDVPLAFQFGT